MTAATLNQRGLGGGAGSAAESEAQDDREGENTKKARTKQGVGSRLADDSHPSFERNEEADDATAVSSVGVGVGGKPWRKFVCHTCDGRVLNGATEWQAHLTSRAHKQFAQRKAKHERNQAAKARAKALALAAAAAAAGVHEQQQQQQQQPSAGAGAGAADSDAVATENGAANSTTAAAATAAPSSTADDAGAGGGAAGAGVDAPS